MENDKKRSWLAGGLRKTEVVEYVGMLIGLFANIPGLLAGALGVLILKKGAEASLEKPRSRPIQVFPGPA